MFVPAVAQGAGMGLRRVNKKHKFYADVHTEEGGHITIYRQPERSGLIWQYRVFLGAERRYITRSAKTQDFGEAMKAAKRAYFKGQEAVAAGTTKLLFARPFREDVQTFNDQRLAAVNAKQRSRTSYDRMKSSLEWWVKYFHSIDKKFTIHDITPKLIAAFPVWRQQQTTQAAKTTILRYHVDFKSFLLWARDEEGLIVKIPVFKYTLSQKEKGRRDEFTQPEWEKILEVLETLADINRNVSREELYQANAFKNYCLLLRATGTRPSELMHVKWKDVQLRKAQGEPDYHLLRVPTGKTGKRDVVARHIGAYAIVKQIAVATFYDLYDENRLVFEDLTDREKRFAEVVDQAGVDPNDHQGKRRPLYSIRHLYATEQLLLGVRIEVLAKNMGTDVKHIMNHYGHVRAPDFAAELTKGDRGR
jgi:integrase